MKQTNLELLRKFETIKTWMVEDLKRAMFEAKANFLVAQGLFAYTEIIGSFITGEGESHGGENFDTFFGFLGNEYQRLLNIHNKRKNKPHVLYDDLRCGLLHEYAVKRKGFIIYNANRFLTDVEIKAINQVNFNGRKITVKCGVTHQKEGRNKSYWLLVDPIYWLDFKNGIDKYWQLICDENKTDMRKNFFKRAREINLRNFNV